MTGPGPSLCSDTILCSLHTSNMARVALTAQKATTAGVVVTFTAATVDGVSFIPASGRVLHVKNGSGGSITLTLPTPQVVDGLAVADRTITVAAAAETAVGVGPNEQAYRQANQSVWVDFSAFASVTVALVDGPA